MDFTYVGDGLLRLCGKALVGQTICIPFKFAEGSTVFLCETTSKCGRLEKIVIKEVKLIPPGTTNSFQTEINAQWTPMYYDTYNAVYNEDELCSQAEVIEIATAYWERQAEIARLQLESCT